MKKNDNYKWIIGFIIGVLLAIPLVYAVTTYASSDVYYNNGVSTSVDAENYFGIKFSSVDRVTDYDPSLTCSRNVDSFTVSRLNGNGKLDYPIGLLTMDEALLAGVYGSSNLSYLGLASVEYWLMTPAAELNTVPYNYTVSNFGLFSNEVDENLGVRPAISLKTGFKLASNSGDGTGNSPYVVE